jgi:hypothetical protein
VLKNFVHTSFSLGREIFILISAPCNLFSLNGCVLYPLESMCCLAFLDSVVAIMSDCRRGFELEIGFIDHFNTRLVTTLNCRAIADFHTLQITTAHAVFLVCCVFTIGSLVTASDSGDSSTAPTKSSLHRLLYNSLTNSKSKSHCD